MDAVEAGLLAERDRLLAVEEDERDLGRIVEVCNDLGGRYRHRGRQAESLEAFNTALEAAEKLMGTRVNKDFAVLLVNVGGTYRYLRRFDEALACYEEARAILSKLGLERSFECASALNNQGLTLQDMGERARALELAEEAHDIVFELADWVTQASSLVNLGSFALAADDLDKAQDYCDRAFALYMEHDPDNVFYNATNLRAVIRYRQGDAEGALAGLEECREKILATFGINEDYHSCLLSIAKVLDELGRHEEAEGRRAEARDVAARLS